jgi:hypothetical protein
MPVMRCAVKLWITLMLLVVHAAAVAFGPTGHRVAGMVAESHLCPQARQYIEPLLDGTTLANAGVWADWIRADPAWAHSKPWHYINVADTEPLEKAMRAGDNVLIALARFELELADERLSRERRAEALRFFVHLLADVHQPLHVGRAEDRGGNDIDVAWRSKRQTLHALWDAEWLLERDRLTTPEVARSIGSLAIGEAQHWQASDALAWAEESRRFRPLVYALPGAGRSATIPLDAAYLATARNVLSLRLAQAGVRLAGRLNRIADCGDS